MVQVCRMILKVVMWLLIIGFGANLMMQTISYSFYKNAKHMKEVAYVPEPIQMTEKLSGYGYHLDAKADEVILFFGGSNYIAYNSVAKFAGKYNCPFIAVDYYGTQASLGKMNLKTMQQSTADFYDWAKAEYPQCKFIVMGHSYGTGMAAYLASVRTCDKLILLSAYRDLSDLYNKIIPIFWGPMKIFLSNNISLKSYAKAINCPVYIIGSKADGTLDAKLQQKVADCFVNTNLEIFEDVSHENYLVTEKIVDYINDILRNEN